MLVSMSKMDDCRMYRNCRPQLLRREKAYARCVCACVINMDYGGGKKVLPLPNGDVGISAIESAVCDCF